MNSDELKAEREYRIAERLGILTDGRCHPDDFQTDQAEAEADRAVEELRQIYGEIKQMPLL